MLYSYVYLNIIIDISVKYVENQRKKYVYLHSMILFVSIFYKNHLFPRINFYSTHNALVFLTEMFLTSDDPLRGILRSLVNIYTDNITIYERIF